MSRFITCQICQSNFELLPRHRTQICYSRTCRMISAKVHYKKDRRRNYAFWYELQNGQLVRQCVINARRVYQLHYGIKLPSDVHVHHINGDRLDDCPQNLEAVHAFDHHAFEHSIHDAHLPGMFHMGKVSSINRPIKDGWYWVQCCSDLPFEIVRIYKQQVRLITGTITSFQDFHPYKWGYRIELLPCIRK